MTNAAIQRELVTMKADIRKLQKSAQTSAALEKARTHLRAEITKGLESGPATKINATFWKKMHALALRHAKRT